MDSNVPLIVPQVNSNHLNNINLRMLHRLREKYWLDQPILVNEKIHKKDVTKFIICGLFGVAINQLLFFEGLNLTTPINAAIIMTCNPILVIIMSFLILKDIFYSQLIFNGFFILDSFGSFLKSLIKSFLVKFKIIPAKTIAGMIVQAISSFMLSG